MTTPAPDPIPRRLSQPIAVALISAFAAIFAAVIVVTIPLIFIKVQEVHTLVNARASAQDSTIRSLNATILRNDSTIASLVTTTAEVRAAMDTLRMLGRVP